MWVVFSRMQLAHSSSFKNELRLCVKNELRLCVKTISVACSSIDRLVFCEETKEKHIEEQDQTNEQTFKGSDKMCNYVSQKTAPHNMGRKRT